MLIAANNRQAHNRSGVAIRPILAKETVAVLRAILEASDQGVLLTDLEHRALACNRRFGEIFDIDPEVTVRCEVEELRRRVEHLIPDKAAWVAMLDRVYARPMEVYEDEQLLLKTPSITVRRFTGPVLHEDGTLLGRLWTFLDISKDRRRQQIETALYEVSTFHDPDPAIVYGHVLQVISDLYGGSTAILSIRRGDRMDYRCIKGPPSLLKRMKGVQIKDSYCRLVLRDLGPKLIQDTRKHPDTKRMLAAFVGYSRYLGVPIHDSAGNITGTVCFLDRRSGEQLNEEDVRFISLLAMRIGAEVAREDHLQSRLAEQRQVLELQKRDLESTQEVLTAMNRAFGLIGGSSLEALASGQVSLLPGLLGFHSAAILIPSQDGTYRCFASVKSGGKTRSLAIAAHECPELAAAVEQLRTSGNDGITTLHESRLLSETLRATHVILAPLQHEGRLLGVLAWGCNELPNPNDRHHRAHAAALRDQISILLATQALHQDLFNANSELSATQRRLVQSEKLSIVGTLAAGVAHDIKNILASLSFELTSTGQEPEQALASVREQLDRFSVLAHRLLSYAKPRLVASQKIHLAEVLNRVLALTGPQLRICSVSVQCEYGDQLPPIIGDPHQLEHLFINLVLNSVQAMSAGGTLGLKATKRGSHLVIEVRDSGRGIPKEAIKNLFEPFYSTRTEGFGLGLYSCKRIVEEHRGEISVVSRPNTGTTFRITLPIETKELGDKA